MAPKNTLQSDFNYKSIFPSLKDRFGCTEESEEVNSEKATDPKLKIAITIENQNDSELGGQTFPLESQKRLQIVENNLHTPEKGRTSLRLRDGQLHQLIHEQPLPDNGPLRIRIPYCGQWIILCVEYLAPPELEPIEHLAL